MTRLRRLPAVLALALLTLGACADDADDPTPVATDPAAGVADTAPSTSSGVDGTGTATVDDVLARLGLAGTSGAELVDALEATPLAERPDDLMASVRYDSVQLSTPTSAAPVELALDEDLFYVSVAPYVDETHDCWFHSLTTCRGELAGAELDVRVVDRSGQVLLDEQVTTEDNGFAGLWLPRDVEGTLSVTHEGLSGELPIATGPDDPTCLTTLRLA